MKREELIKRRLISEYVPDSFKPEKSYFSRIVRETKKFITEHFRGAAEVTGCELMDFPTEFSFEGYAYLIKLILNSIFGDGRALVEFEYENETLSVYFKRQRGVFSESEIAELSSCAKLSGIGIEFFETAVKLTFKRKVEMLAKLYKGFPDFRLRSTFVYVFYTAKPKRKKQ